ncbi:leucyl aminopeptidase [Candidatus Woesearchaeota archaeon]|nr:leucyl aminopeptidase [Candidatus Woesearchaeota archaeon]
MKVDVVDAKFDSFKTELIVVGLFYPAEKVPEELKSVDEKLHGAIAHALKGREFEGDWQQFRLVSTLDKIPAKNILLVGLGRKDDADLELLRRAAGFSAKVARDFCGITEFSTTLHTVEVADVSKEDRAQAVAEGSVLGAYQYIKYRTVEKERIKVIQKVTLVGDGVSASVKKGSVLAECANLVRDLENEPASNMKPVDLADIAKSLEKLGVKVNVYDKKAIEKLGLHAVLAVNKGSVNEPRFVVMEYDGGGRKVAVVGKGITFDSGGLDIKKELGMLNMKHDLAGAGVVIATVKAAALLKLKINLIGVFAATENMLGMDAYKPGDIISTYSGKTVEIINTDAEGRLVLCDGLAFTEKNFKPSAIIDLGTVTGACIIALGSVCAGIMGKDEKLIQRLIKSGNLTGERVWELPLFREYRDQVKSDFADLRNLGIFKSEAGAITAGAFLSAFVEKTPWAHIDIAGTAWSDIDLDYVRKGGTGFGVRLLINALENWGD